MIMQACEKSEMLPEKICFFIIYVEYRYRVDIHCVGRKGVGAALLARVMQEARTRGVASVYAYVRADNKVT